jgi:tripartite-type tricarboxylate transporter receptor subunit TctC
MKLPHRRLPGLAAGFTVVAAVALTAVLVSDFAWSQSARTIKLIVPFPPGGGIDALGRILAEEISRAQKTSMVVENRPGAGTLIATESAICARSATTRSRTLFRSAD